jgi:outer membrane protein OmpA-like peptidoglycan-associated protein
MRGGAGWFAAPAWRVLRQGFLKPPHGDHHAVAQQVDRVPHMIHFVVTARVVLQRQIQFALDSAKILPESTSLLTEIADVFIRNPRVRRVELQGHTDNSGTPDHNKSLSEDRANAVVAWLVAHGVESSRLVARGYGQGKPLVPNVTAANRARNRRVQFIILEQDAATKAEPAAPTGKPGAMKAPAPKAPAPKADPNFLK